MRGIIKEESAELGDWLNKNDTEDMLGRFNIGYEWQASNLVVIPDRRFRQHTGWIPSITPEHIRQTERRRNKYTYPEKP